MTSVEGQTVFFDKTQIAVKDLVVSMIAAHFYHIHSLQAQKKSSSKNGCYHGKAMLEKTLKKRTNARCRNRVDRVMAESARPC